MPFIIIPLLKETVHEKINISKNLKLIVQWAMAGLVFDKSIDFSLLLKLKVALVLFFFFLVLRNHVKKEFHFRRPFF